MSAWIDPEDDALFDEMRRRREAMSRASARVTPEMAANASAIHGYAPWLGTTSIALAAEGHTVDSPLVRQVAEHAARSKTKRGTWARIGDWVSAPVREVGEALEIGSRGPKGAIRTAFAVAESPLQELQGLIRGAGWGGAKYREDHGYINPLDPGYWRDMAEGVARSGRSTSVIALRDLWRTMNDKKPGVQVDLGSGFFSGGAVKAEQEKQGEYLTLGGEPISVGRVVAHKVSEPGTKPYNVLSGALDAAVAIWGDPLNIPTAGAAEAFQTRRALGEVATKRTLPGHLAEAVGLVKARSSAVVPERANAWLGSAPAQALFDDMAGDASFNSLWLKTRKKMPVELVEEIRATSDPKAVEEIVRRAIFTGRLGEKIPTGLVADSGTQVRRSARSVRWLASMPGDHLDFDDVDQAVRQIDAFQRNAKVPEELISENNSRLARGLGRPERIAAVKPALKAVADSLVAHGISDAQANKLTEVFERSRQHASVFAYDAAASGRELQVPTVMADGGSLPLNNVHAYGEYLNRTMPLPNVRDIRRATSVFRPLLELPGVGKSATLLDAMAQGIWKPLVLIRGAWTVRVIAEEQIRMANSGLTSMFAHPLSYLAMVTSADSKTGRLLSHVGVEAGRMEGGLVDDVLRHTQEHRDAMSKSWAQVRGPRGMLRTKHMDFYVPDDPEFVPSWADELVRMHEDPVWRRVLEEPGTAKDWFKTGAGQEFRKELAVADERFTDDAFADAWVDSLVTRAKPLLADDARIAEAVVTGKLNGRRLTDGTTVDKAVLTDLEAIRMEGRHPGVVKGWSYLSAKGKTNPLMELYDSAVQTGFSAFMGVPESKLSRSVTFRQMYWGQAEKVASLMTPEAQAALLARAAERGLPEADVRRLAAATKVGTGELTIEQVDTVSKAVALDGTKDLLYDLATRSQFFDIYRLLFPFGEAWLEMIKVWSKIGVETGGRSFRRLQQGIGGARGAGWFTTDPQTGEEVFNYPGSDIINEHIAGVRVPMKGRVGGLNLVGQVMPGLGPVAQVPMSKILPDKPEWDWVRDIVLPFGEPGVTGPLVATPAWMQKLKTAFNDPDSDRMFGNTVMDVARYLKSTGEYPADTDVEVERLMSAAKARARTLYVVRGVAQFVAPSAPAWNFKTADGKVAQLLVDDFRKMQNDDYDTAVIRFLEKYGEDSLLYMQSKSRSVAGSLASTSEASDWARQHPDLVKQFPDVWGLFAPEGGKFDPNLYARQLESGAREALTPREAVLLANSRVASMIYSAARDRVPNTDAARSFLRELKSGLQERYPGYNESLGLSERAKFPQVLQQLQTSLGQPAMAKTEAGQGLAVYLTARDKAVEAAKALGLAGFGSAARAAPLREWLRTVVTAISQRYPDFSEMFDRVLAREFTARDEVAA